jgi:hypothetical protein
MAPYVVGIDPAAEDHLSLPDIDKSASHSSASSMSKRSNAKLGSSLPPGNQASACLDQSLSIIALSSSTRAVRRCRRRNPDLWTRTAPWRGHREPCVVALDEEVEAIDLILVELDGQRLAMAASFQADHDERAVLHILPKLFPEIRGLCHHSAPNHLRTERRVSLKISSGHDQLVVPKARKNLHEAAGRNARREICSGQSAQRQAALAGDDLGTERLRFLEQLRCRRHAMPRAMLVRARSGAAQ